LAVTPPSDAAFLREVDEELRRDQLAGFGRRFGLWVAAAIVGALILFAGFLWWQHHRAQVAGEQSERLGEAYNAMAAKQFAKADPVLTALATGGTPGNRALAIFTQGDQLLLQKNDAKGAAAKFASVANDDGIAKPFRDLALIRQTAIEFDTLKPGVVVERLRPLATRDGPWLGSAGEMVAAAYLKQGRRDLAGRMFAQIAQSNDVPPTLRQRSVQMAGVLGIDAATPIGEAQAK
jgi:hypothetical protein